MKRLDLMIIATALATLMIVGCGSSSTTYEQDGTVLPQEPTDGTSLIVTADNESQVGLVYTELGDGAIMIECGDGDYSNCELNVFEAIEVNTSI